MIYCLNRNILECKFKIGRTANGEGVGLNRNILECKLDHIRLTIQHHLVLIETYWNVNFVLTGGEAMLYDVLIETYWNVNADDDFISSNIELGLNRNILECK